MSTQAVSRRLFLHGDFNTSGKIRPPWSIDEKAFIDRCTRCFECASACPSHLIIKGDGGFPEISFKRHGCDFCEACVRACSPGALVKSDEQEFAWLQVASITDQCFSKRGVVCRSCGEICETRAIRFIPGVGGLQTVELNTEQCNGCGECVHVCPAHAIEITKHPVGDLHE